MSPQASSQVSVYLAQLNTAMHRIMSIDDLMNADYSSVYKTVINITEQTKADTLTVLEVSDYLCEKVKENKNTTAMEALVHYFSKLDADAISPHAIMILRLLFCNTTYFSIQQDRKACIANKCTVFSKMQANAMKQGVLDRDQRRLQQLQHHLQAAFCT